MEDCSYVAFRYRQRRKHVSRRATHSRAMNHTAEQVEITGDFRPGTGLVSLLCRKERRLMGKPKLGQRAQLLPRDPRRRVFFFFAFLHEPREGAHRSGTHCVSTLSVLLLVRSLARSLAPAPREEERTNEISRVALLNLDCSRIRALRRFVSPPPPRRVVSCRRCAGDSDRVRD